jgi:GYF domain 2
MGPNGPRVCEEAKMNGPVTETQWYIAREGKQHGPLTDIEMRTFVAHSYLRPSDLIWRPGMAEWLPAPQIFPAVFPAAVAAPAPPVATPAPASMQSAQVGNASGSAPLTSDFENGDVEDEIPRRSVGRRLATAAAIITVIGGGAFAFATYREPLMRMVTGDAGAKVETAKVETPAPPVVEAPAAVETTPAPVVESKPVEAATAPTAAPETQTAALTPHEPPAGPPNIDGSQIDARLQKIPVWALIKKDYPDWYVGHIAAAEKMVTDKRPESDVAMHLAQGIVTLRRQHAEKALSASPDKLRRVASAFLDNLKSLQSQGVSACYGFISKGEVSPAIVQQMQTPENATAFNAHVSAIFEAIDEGGKKPSTHAAAVKGDYDILIKELGKIGWKEDDLQTFSNPRLLSKRAPDQVCKMVLEWFVAHLAVKDKAVQDRLLYETLKPVVTG